MVRRKSNRKSRYAKKNALGLSGTMGILSGVVGLLVIVGFGSMFAFNQPVELVSKTLCRTDEEPSSSVAILIDNTDRISERSAMQARVYIKKIIDVLPNNALVSVFVMSEDSSTHITPLISRCRPADGLNANQLVANPVLMKKRFEDEFYTPLFSAIDNLFEKDTAKFSPILESLYSISIEAFTPYSDSVKKSLVVVSDMLQHSEQYSMYSSQPDYSLFSSNAAKEGAYPLSLSGVNVEFLVLPRAVPVGTRADVVKFWQLLLQDKRADLGSSMQPL